ncbi:MAG: DNA-formamidopyrimidine glycosylase [Cyanobacteria bacterium P01_H01_bin.121]
MPELPEVETVRRGLQRHTLNANIIGGEVLLERTIAHPPAVRQFIDQLTGCQLQDWQRRGKYLLAQLTQSQKPAGWLGVHLRMTGQLFWLAKETPLQSHTRVRLFCEQASPAQPAPNHYELRFVDIRTFGQMWWVPPETPPEKVITGLQALGPEPFSADFSVAYFQQRLQRSRRPIKTALLDQAIVAGLGNIYADESLFLSQIHPTKLTHTLKPRDVQKLHQAIQHVLRESIEHGGTTLRDFRDLQGVNGNYGGVARVYHRTGEPCLTCQTPIERIKLAGRSTHFCPRCQPQ